MVSFPWLLKTMRFPILGCPEVAHSLVQMREHFIYMHFFARIAVMQEGRKPLPHCDLCGMHMQMGRLLKYQRTKRFDRNTQMLWRRREMGLTERSEERRETHW